MSMIDDETRLQYIRAAFSTWLSDRGLFKTLSLLAQVKFKIDSRLDAPIAISISVKSMIICIKPQTLKVFEISQDAMFFLIMHELRHINQLPSISAWDSLLSLHSINEVVRERVPQLRRGKVKLFDAEQLHELKHHFTNLAADAALHEDLIKVFPKGTLEKLDEILYRLEKSENPELAQKGKSITVKGLSQILGKKLKKEQDWLYYAKKLVGWYTIQLEKYDEELLSLIDFGLSKTLRNYSWDQHSWEQHASPFVQNAIERAGLESNKVRAIQNLPEEEIEQIGGEEKALFDSRARLSSSIRAALDKVKKSVVRHHKPFKMRTQSFHRPNKYLIGLPSNFQQSQVNPVSSVVLVLDTSGSMWHPDFMEQMLALARTLEANNQLDRAYCCDVELSPLTLKTTKMTEVTGGGGTVWNPDLHTQILEDLKVESGIRIIYLTDEIVSGLDDARQDPRVILEVINIPALLAQGEAA